MTGVGIHPIATVWHKNHRLHVHKNSIADVLITVVLIGLVLVTVWGTTFAAQAITGRRTIQHGRCWGAVSAPHCSPSITVAIR